MLKSIKILVGLGVIALTSGSCSDYQKALKSEDTKVKYDMAEKLYNEEKYNKASRLFEQIMPKYVGKPQGERVVYMYANSAFQTEDYYLSAYQFERFSNSYPRSEKAEEAFFLSAKSYYLQSPKYSIDQTETKQGLVKLQNFINNYPNSEYMQEANTMVQELTEKLEKKDLEIAKQYEKTYYYKAAIQSVDNFMLDYPGSKYKEEALFVKFKATYFLGVNSFENLVVERLQDAKEIYQTLKKNYPQSTYIKEADGMFNNLEEELNKRS